VGGFLLVARGRTLETFKFRRAPGGSGRLVGWSDSTKSPLVLPTDGKTGKQHLFFVVVLVVVLVLNACSG
jgi:hypothetical protein